jgi:hypothetical protein
MSYEVYTPNTEVTICEGRTGRVVAVMVERGFAVTYKVGWWKDGDWKESWLPSAEVMPLTGLTGSLGSGKTSITKIGFRLESQR